MDSWKVDRQQSTTRGGFLGIAFITAMALITLVIVKNINKARDLEVSAAGRFDLVEKKLVKLFDSEDNFGGKVVREEFSSVSCCRSLINQYEHSGITFSDDINSGWTTYQGSGFVGSIKTSTVEPGSPSGISGTRIEFVRPVRRMGFYLQGDGVFDSSRKSIGKKIKLTAYDNSGNAVFQRSIDTCYDEDISCTPKLIGLEAKSAMIGSVEISIQEPYSYSIDNLMWER